MRILLLFFLAVPLLTPSLYAQPDGDSIGTLVVQVVGLESNTGTVRIALNDEHNYDSDGNVRTATLPITDGTAQWIVDRLSYGTYAVRLYHDENDNGELDTNLFGAPQEAYGFSNDARGRFGPPDFEEAAFSLDSDSLSMTVRAQ